MAFPTCSVHTDANDSIPGTAPRALLIVINAWISVRIPNNYGLRTAKKSGAYQLVGAGIYGDVTNCRGVLPQYGLAVDVKRNQRRQRQSETTSSRERNTSVGVPCSTKIFLTFQPS